MDKGVVFTPIFIEYLKSIFVNNPNTAYSTETMCEAMPSFFKDGEMVSAGINILHLNKTVEHNGRNEKNHDVYIVTRSSLEEIDHQAEHKRLTEEFGLKIQKGTLLEMGWQRWPRKYWYIVMVVGIVLTAASTKLLESQKKELQPSLSRQEIRLIIDSSLNHKSP